MQHVTQNLTDLSDAELVKKVQKYEDNDSLKELIGRHSDLCYYIYNKYQPKMEQSGVLSSSEFSDKDYIVYQSAKSYNPNKKSKYSTWLANQVRFHCLNTIKHKVEFAVEDKTLDVLRDNVNDDFARKNNSYLDLSHIHNTINQFKDKRIKKIFEMRYFGEKKCSWAKIGEELKLTVPMVIILHKRAVDMIKKKLTSMTVPDII